MSYFISTQVNLQSMEISEAKKSIRSNCLNLVVAEVPAEYNK